VRVDDERIEFGDIEQLADDMRHAVDVLAQGLADLLVFQGIKAGSQNTQRRPQLVSGIGVKSRWIRNLPQAGRAPG